VKRPLGARVVDGQEHAAGLDLEPRRHARARGVAHHEVAQQEPLAERDVVAAHFGLGALDAQLDADRPFALRPLAQRERLLQARLDVRPLLLHGGALERDLGTAGDRRRGLDGRERVAAAIADRGDRDRDLTLGLARHGHAHGLGGDLRGKPARAAPDDLAAAHGERKVSLGARGGSVPPPPSLPARSRRRCRRSGRPRRWQGSQRATSRRR
jgi:hypothetical protein